MNEYEQVLKFFKNDVNKTMEWFNTKNPLLGNVAPLEMIVLGREGKLKKWIRVTIEEGDE